jgi:hypothetical protein
MYSELFLMRDYKYYHHILVVAFLLGGIISCQDSPVNVQSGTIESRIYSNPSVDACFVIPEGYFPYELDSLRNMVDARMAYDKKINLDRTVAKELLILDNNSAEMVTLSVINPHHLSGWYPQSVRNLKADKIRKHVESYGHKVSVRESDISSKEVGGQEFHYYDLYSKVLTQTNANASTEEYERCYYRKYNDVIVTYDIISQKPIPGSSVALLESLMQQSCK